MEAENRTGRIRIYVSYEFDNVDRVADYLPKEPSKLVRKGDRSPSGRSAVSDYVCYRSLDGLESEDINRHWKDIEFKFRSLLESKLEEFALAAKVVSIVIEVSFEHDFPLQRLPAELVDFAARQAAAIDIDVYEIG